MRRLLLILIIFIILLGLLCFCTALSSSCASYPKNGGQTCPASEFCLDVNNTRNLSDRAALEILYLSTGGNNWYNSTNWLDENVSHCAWAGVCCESELCRVVSLALGNNNVSGDLPNVFGKLPALMSLSFTCNPLRTGLNAVLSQNNSSLTTIMMNDCLLDEELLDFELNDFNNLTTLQLANNFIRGTIPGTIFGLPKLAQINLSHNKLSGTIPPLESVSIFSLRLSNNQLTGSIPSSIFSQALTTLDVSFNSFTGSLPILGKASRIVMFNCVQCGLSGPLTEELFALTNRLEQLYLSQNRFSGPVPAGLFVLPSLRVVHLDSNNLTESLPATITFSPKLVELLLRNNQIHGDLNEDVKINHVDIRNNPSMRWNPITGPLFWQEQKDLSSGSTQQGYYCFGLASPNTQTRLLVDGQYYDFQYCHCNPGSSGIPPFCSMPEYSSSTSESTPSICYVYLGLVVVLAALFIALCIGVALLRRSNSTKKTFL